MEKLSVLKNTHFYSVNAIDYYLWLDKFYVSIYKIHFSISLQHKKCGYLNAPLNQ